jgi:chemotaxis protein CheD
MPNLVVGVSDMQVSKHPDDVLVTYALGSCLGIAIHDPVASVGGLLHVMLPDSSLDPDQGASRPAMFVDTGVPRLFRAAYAVGAVKERIVVKVAGGASLHAAGDQFQIGKRNVIKLRELLWKNGVLLKAAEVGGTVSRTMTLNVGTGAVLLKVNGTEMRL